jgi:O-antigen/teichoic acid export membrane protein
VGRQPSEEAPIKRRLPAVTQQIGAVAIGLFVLGLASFAFISIAGRELGPAVFAPLGTLWVIVNAAGPAFFQSLEQELGRGIAHRHAHGVGSRTFFLRGATLAGGLVLVCAVCLLAFSAPLADAVFRGQRVLVLALVIGLAGLGAEHLTRGAFAGGQAFTRYGWQLGLDGALRLAASVVLAVLAVHTVGWYGFALAVAPVLAVVLTVRRLGPAMEPGPDDHRWAELLRAVAVLIAGTALSQFVVNAAPVAANVLAGPDEAARAGVFISVLVLARIPLFLFSAVQAAFLPGLAALVARDDREGFRRRLRAVLTLVGALGVAGVLGFVSLGPWLVGLLYGPAYATTRLDIWPLAVGAALFMLAAALAQTLISLQAYGASVLGWALGTATFLGVVSVHLRLEQRVGLAFFAATLVAAVTAALALRRRLGRPLLDRRVRAVLTEVA